MGIKKIARPMNKAKNAFVKWLQSNKATDLDGLNDQPSCPNWEYYMMISGFIGDDLYSACFMVWEQKGRIEYSDKKNRYTDLSIAEFMLLIE